MHITRRKIKFYYKIIEYEQIGRTDWPNRLAEQIGRTDWPNRLAEQIGRTDWPNRLAEQIGRTRTKLGMKKLFNNVIISENFV
jgi:hypothetical protein